MNAASRIKELNSLKDEFKAYLRDTNPHWSDSTVSTIGADAFFALNNYVGVDFWASLVSEESFHNVRDKIRNYLARTKGAGNTDERADGYLFAFRRLKAFLDIKHPEIPAEWSVKTVCAVSFESDFKEWMKTEKKDLNNPLEGNYSPKTISTYTAAMKNSTAKLGLGDAVLSNIFLYKTADEFDIAYQRIRAAPNFSEVDDAAGNGSYSAGMKLYVRFLKTQREPSAWIFQGNPKYCDVVAAVEALDKLTWAVNQYPKQIKKNDKAYIWVSGSDGGIIASGSIICDPEIREPNLNDPYISGKALKSKPYLAVDIQIERRFISEKVPRALLLVDERTKQLEILTYPGATNFRITRTQEKAIESIIDGSCERVPVGDGLKEESASKRRYWLYSPGEQAKLWYEFYGEGIMGIGGDDLGDLSLYKKKADISAASKQKQRDDKSYKNDDRVLWQFVHDISVGDIVYAKRGMGKIIGRGVVESGYIFDNSRRKHKSIHKVNWTHKGEWGELEYPGKAAVKALTNISPYTGYIEKLETLILGESGPLVIDVEPEFQYPDYTAADFLNDVYISAADYKTLKGLLLRKKNVILQGPPGVGKTFAAQRLAYSIMGEIDTSRVKIIQFHQSYGYEDFIMGYRPDGGGFRLAEGPFYKFCKAAEEDDERPYFFIIDEINRGNLGKIFGELLMLIEGDKRGEKNALCLLYKDEQFSVPANIHIIGMMNTADRSLAMIDYALRRRFAFFDMEPAFQSDGFKARQTAIQNQKFDALVSVVESLNRIICNDASLGRGFRVGHSYFCANDVVDDAWLKSVVEYELKPLLNEYWFDDPSKAEAWTKQLRSAVDD